MNQSLLKTAIFSLIVTFSVTASAQEQWGMTLQNNNQGKVQQLTPEQAKAIIEGKKKPTSVYREKSNQDTNDKKSSIQSQNVFENKNKKQLLFQSSDDKYSSKTEKQTISKNTPKEDIEKSKFGSQPSNALEAIKGDRKVNDNVRDFSKMRRFSQPKNSVTFTPN